MQRTKTFQYNDATITVRRATIRDRLTIDALQWQLPDTDLVPVRHQQRAYLRAVVQTTSVDGDLGFTLPKPDAPDAALAAGFEAMMDAPGTLWDIWRLTLEQVDGAIADPDLAPTADPKGKAASAG